MSNRNSGNEALLKIEAALIEILAAFVVRICNTRRRG